jgi:hypothetical protein
MPRLFALAGLAALTTSLASSTHAATADPMSFYYDNTKSAPAA